MCVFFGFGEVISFSLNLSPSSIMFLSLRFRGSIMDDCRKMHVPGIMARHAIISDDCRVAHGDLRAFEIAVERLRESYLQSCGGFPISRGAKLHVMFSVERRA